jgi:hypothetical protein
LRIDLKKITLDELGLKDREAYYVIMRIKNQLGYVSILHSDGITVKLDPLMPGNVRDGNLTGIDQSYQSSLTSISANWDGFGTDRNDGSFDEYVTGTNKSRVNVQQLFVYKPHF